MNFSDDFKELIDKCIQSNQYVGLGNPNAKILVVGKEAGIPIGSELNHGSGKSWKENKIDYSMRYKAIEDKLKSKNHTWQKYQKLYDIILNKLEIADIISTETAYDITFVENIFTTELSNLAAPKTNDAKKQKGFKTELEKRKKVFWDSRFIKQFPIVIITATDNKYIENYRGEVCDIFEVEFFEQYLCAKTDKLWIHYAVESKNKIFPKLVIHTRQLTNGASNKLLDKVADVVCEFVKKYDIKIKVK